MKETWIIVRLNAVNAFFTPTGWVYEREKAHLMTEETARYFVGRIDKDETELNVPTWALNTANLTF